MSFSEFISSVSESLKNITTEVQNIAVECLKVAPKVAQVLEKVLPVVLTFSPPQFKPFIAGALVLAKALGVCFPDCDDPEILGDKILQANAQGININDFDSIEEYWKAVEAIELDPSLSHKFTEQEKLASVTSVLLASIAEQNQNNPRILNFIGSFSNPSMRAICTAPIMTELTQSPLFDLFCDYTSGSLDYPYDETKIKMAESGLIDALEKHYPDKTSKELTELVRLIWSQSH